MLGGACGELGGACGELGEGGAPPENPAAGLLLQEACILSPGFHTEGGLGLSLGRQYLPVANSGHGAFGNNCYKVAGSGMYIVATRMFTLATGRTMYKRSRGSHYSICFRFQREQLIFQSKEVFTLHI